MTRKEKQRILVVDDHKEMISLIADQLQDVGYEVDVASSGAEASKIIKSRFPDLVITDLRMDGTDGFDLLANVQQTEPSIPVIIMTAFGGVDTAIEAIKRGAYHYLTKPFQLKEMLVFVQRALEERRLKDENRALTKLVKDRASLNMILGQSPPMRAMFDLIERVASSNAPVLVRGESGTGKELVARTIHLLNPRNRLPFVAINCTTLPESILESELFGHVRGAFTGAMVARRGLFAEADGGSLFLDEIGDMPTSLQAKLLRVLEDGEIRSVGADTMRKVDVRLIVATHQNLEERVREGLFRTDLFYRLNVVPIVVPPLRDRVEDIPLLVEHFLERARQANPHCMVRQFSPKSIALLSSHYWPGNVRELENIVKRLTLVCTSEVIEPSDIKSHAPLSQNADFSIQRPKERLIPLRQLEEEYICWVIDQCDGNKTRAAEILAIDVSTIHRREKGHK